MVNVDDIIREKKEYNPIWPSIFDYPYQIISGVSGSGKANGLLNVIVTNQTLIKLVSMLGIHMPTLHLLNLLKPF